MKLKFVIITILILFLSIRISSQIRSEKTSFMFDNRPVLTIEKLELIDENQNQYADAGEKCFLAFHLKNSGKSPAKSVNIQLQTQNPEMTIFAFEKSLVVGTLKAGDTKQIKIPVNPLTGYENSLVTFEILAKETNGYDSKPVKFIVNYHSSSKKATVNWYQPVLSESKVFEKSYLIKACIVSNNGAPVVEVYLNNKLHSTSRGFKLIKKADCSYYLEYSLSLDKGNNLIQIMATDNSGKIQSEMRNVIYEEIVKERRVALVIGNAAYNEAPLRNPVNDATLMSSELKKLGFEVTTLKNCTQNQLKQAITEFGNNLAADKNTVGLFYYAGHGIQVKGKNYLVPTDANIVKEPDVEVFCVDLDGLLANLEYSANNLNIIILDACRNNPYSRGFRSGAGPGLASVNAPVGTLIAYATAPGSVAADGEGNNGLYTEEFVKVLAIPNLKIEDVFKRVRTQVKNLSKGMQVPWENSSIEGDFYFVK